MIVLDGLWNRFLSVALNDMEDEFLLNGFTGYEGPAGRGSEQPEGIHRTIFRNRQEVQICQPETLRKFLKPELWFWVHTS